MSQEHQELELYSSDDLIEELFGRFEHAIFAGLKTVGPETNNNGTQYMNRRHTGNTQTCIGLAVLVQAMIIDQYKEATEFGQDDGSELDDDDGALEEPD